MERDEEAGKIFVGGLSWETSDDGLKNYFSTFGEVAACNIMRDQLQNRSRGFGFVTFRDPAVVAKILSQQKHVLDGREIDPKAAVPRGSGPPPSSGRGGGSMGRGGRVGGTGGMNWRGAGMDGQHGSFHGPTKKIFIGGIGHGTTEDDIKTYFSSFGAVTEVIVKYDQKTNRMRGFGFVSFDNESSVERLCDIHFHTINGKTVEVKKAEPRQGGGMGQMGSPSHFGMGRGGPAPYEYPGYANTYGQPRGYTPAAGYGAPQQYGSYGAPTAAGYGQSPYGPGTYGGGYGAGGYGQTGPSYGQQYTQTAGYGPGPSQGYSSQAPTSGYESYGTASSQPSQGQDYNSTGTSSPYSYGGAAGRMGGYGQEQSAYGTPQTGAYSQDRSGGYSAQPSGYGQTPPGSSTGAAAGSSDSASYGQQPTGYGGTADYRTAQSFSQGAGSSGQPGRAFAGYQ